MERTVPKLGRVIRQNDNCQDIWVQWIDPKTGYGVVGVYDRYDWDEMLVKGRIPKMGRVIARSRDNRRVTTVWAAANGWRGTCHYRLNMWSEPPLKLALQAQQILSRPPVFVSHHRGQEETDHATQEISAGFT